MAVAATAHTVVNLRRLRTVEPWTPALPAVLEPVSVLLPARDERAHIAAAVQALVDGGLDGLADVEVLVLDDGSSDDTARLAALAADGDPRVRVVDGGAQPPPPGWLGKPWALHRLAAQSRGAVLVLVDADVEVAPGGVAAAVALLRATGLDLVSPYPSMVAVGPAERLVQPLLTWSWLTLVPLGSAERSTRTSTAVAGGQLLVVDAARYAAAGGHAAVRGEVLEDVALLRAVRRAGGHGTVVDGSRVAHCRMYASWAEIRDGYGKSLWCAFGSPAGGLAVAAALAGVYVVPAVAALRGSRAGAAGYLAAVVGRALVARRVGARVLPDVAAHPVSVLAFGALMVDSVFRHRRGTLSWKGRPLP
jgi:hypothetical protein